ncbi:hypothetical protein P5W99_36635 [Paraburkholderia sp. A3BS-1L]|uniref:hypothetical protein n=1 Tax=Paraburkholderia sp. A3BS-1L TaxID=3028375 RepID=UPI003DA9A93B
MNDSKKVQFEQVLEHSVADFLANAPDEELSAFLKEEGLDIATLAQRSRDALVRARMAAATKIATDASTDDVNPFARIPRPEYRNLAETLGINTLFLNRIRDREVLLAEFPTKFLDRLAAGLRVTLDALRLYLSLPPSPAVGNMYRAESKPEMSSEAGSFRAVASESGLSEEDIQRLFK